MSLRIDISDAATPTLNAMHATLTRLRNINQAIGTAIEALCQHHVQQDADGRHGSANKLGADPTGFLGGAVDAIHSTSDEYGATVDFSHFWFARVGHDVDLEASDYGKKLFTIPVDASAYGHRIMIGVDTPRFPGGFWRKSKDQGVAIYVVPDGKGALKVLYIGVPSVHQPQDRTRLPDDETIMDTALMCLKGELRWRAKDYESHGV